MRRVLVITYYWPPAGGSGVQRWVKFAKYLPSEGWQPVIYTPLNPEISSVDETLLKDIPDEAEIIKRPIREPYGIYRKIFGARSSTDMQTLIGGFGKAGATGGEVNPIGAGNKSPAQRLSLWIRGNLFIPDPRIWWVRPSVRFLRKYLKEHPVDMIVTTGPPQSMHLIGLKLHRATGIPWMADFRDPWTKIFYYKHLHLTKASDRKHQRLERKVLDGANAVISVSPFVQVEFQEMTRTPVFLITNGFDEDDFIPKEGEQSGRDSSGKFYITHTGLFAEDGNPLELWDAIAAKRASDAAFREAVRIRLVGKVDAAISASLEERGLGSCTDNLGYRTHDEAIAEQRAAGMLILPLRQEPEYRNVLPGKIFEYLASERPVLGIGQEDGAAAGILEETGAGKMFGWDNGKGIREALDEVWERHLAGETFSTEGTGRYSRRALTHKLATVMEQL